MCIELNWRDAYTDFGVVRVGDSNTTSRLLTTITALVGFGSTRKKKTLMGLGQAMLVCRQVQPLSITVAETGVGGKVYSLHGGAAKAAV